MPRKIIQYVDTDSANNSDVEITEKPKKDKKPKAEKVKVEKVKVEKPKVEKVKVEKPKKEKEPQYIKIVEKVVEKKREKKKREPKNDFEKETRKIMGDAIRKAHSDIRILKDKKEKKK